MREKEGEKGAERERGMGRGREEGGMEGERGREGERGPYKADMLKLCQQKMTTVYHMIIE